MEAVRGRTFTAEEGRVKGANPVVMVSHSLWQKRFGGDPNLPGTTVKLKGHPFIVIGVVPERFTGTDLGRAPDIWVPMSMYAQVGLSDTMMSERENHWLSVIGRLKPGVSVDQAQARVNVLAKQLPQEYPAEWAKGGGEERTVTVLSQRTAWYPPEAQSAILGVSGLLMGIVGLVLLIACTNLVWHQRDGSVDVRSGVSNSYRCGAGFHLHSGTQSSQGTAEYCPEIRLTLSDLHP